MSSLRFHVITLSLLAGISHAHAQDSGEKLASKELSISAGLGVAAHSAPLLNDYINAIGQPGLDQRLDEFTSAPEFFVHPEVRISEDWVLGVEYSLMLKSYSLTDVSGYARSEFSYQVHMPTLTVAYFVPGDGYRFKFGGGLGYHVATMAQNLPSFGSQTDYSTRGFGIKLNAVGNTKFDETFYGLIEVDLRWEFLGALKTSDGVEAVESRSNAKAKMNFFNVGLKFGILLQL